MSVETQITPRYSALAADFPLNPIRDAGSYQAAIAVLDRLFERGNNHPDDRRYFRALARQARSYEQSRRMV